MVCGVSGFRLPFRTKFHRVKVDQEAHETARTPSNSAILILQSDDLSILDLYLYSLDLLINQEDV